MYPRPWFRVKFNRYQSERESIGRKKCSCHCTRGFILGLGDEARMMDINNDRHREKVKLTYPYPHIKVHLKITGKL